MPSPGKCVAGPCKARGDNDCKCVGDKNSHAKRTFFTLFSKKKNTPLGPCYDSFCRGFEIGSRPLGPAVLECQCKIRYDKMVADRRPVPAMVKDYLPPPKMPPKPTSQPPWTKHKAVELIDGLLELIESKQGWMTPSQMEDIKISLIDIRKAL